MERGYLKHRSNRSCVIDGCYIFMSIGQIREDLKKLAKLAANVSEAHTCTIFLPTGLLTSVNSTSTNPTSGNPQSFSASHRAPEIAVIKPHGNLTTLNSQGTPPPQNDTIELKKVFQLGPDLTIGSIEMVATQSISSCLVRDCRIQVGNGLLGWVAENSRSIHVAPFDMDSSVLGIYTETEPLKSLVAVPIPMPTENPNTRTFSGVLMCDSAKAFSFTKAQVKHLEEIATLVSRLVYWTLVKKEATSTESSWDSFLTRTTQLSDAIGHDSIEMVRITVESFPDLESEHGISYAVQQSEQFVRLIQQALPPHFPLVRLPNGDILVALDNMMTTFFQNKIRTLANHLNEQVKPFIIRIQSFSAKASRSRGFDVDTILQSIPTSNTSTISKVVGGSRA